MLRLRSLGRLRQVVAVATRNGFGYLAERLLSEPAFRALRRRRPSHPSDQVAAMRLVASLEELGPTYVKLGQFFSMRPDIFPPVFVRELNRLHEQVRPLPFEAVRKVLEEETGRPAAEFCREIDPEPLAAASLAQVHRAVLADGSRVVLKIQRPGIRQVVRADLEILSELAHLVHRRFPETRVFRPIELASEFRHQLTRELDFYLEAMRIERFRRRFQDDERFYIPRVYWDHCTERVLVLEEISGVQPYPSELAAAGIDAPGTGRLIYQAFLEEVLSFGTFHADPHPGNIFVCRDRLCLLDFGTVGIITEQDREVIIDAIAGLVDEDIDTLVAAFHRFRIISPDINERLFRREIVDFFERYRGLPTNRIRLGQFIIDCLKLGRRFEITFPADMALLGKSLLMIESLAASLDPAFEPLEAAAPVIRRLRDRRLAPGFLLKQARSKLRLAAQGLSEMPALLFSLVRKAESGHLKIHFLHEGLEGTTRELEGALNRLAAALVLAALIISATLLYMHLRG